MSRYDLIEKLNYLADVTIEDEVRALLEHDWSESFGCYRADLVEKYLEIHDSPAYDGISVAELGDALIRYLCDFQEKVIDVHCDHYARNGSVGISSTDEVLCYLDQFDVGLFVMRRSDRVKNLLSRLSDMTISGDVGFVYAPMHVAVSLYAVPAPDYLVDMYS